MTSRIEENSIEEDDDDYNTEDEDSSYRDDEKNAVMNLLLKANGSTKSISSASVGSSIATASTAPVPAATPQPPTNSRLTMARPSVLMTAQNYEQISVKEILSRLRSTTKAAPRQSVVGVGTSKDPIVGLEEEGKDRYEYMLEAPKSGLNNRDEVLQPLFLPTKCEVEDIPVGLMANTNGDLAQGNAKKDLPPSLDPNKTYPEVRQVIYCMDQQLFRQYQEEQLDQGSTNSKQAGKSHWGLQFDSNFECGNLFEAESVMKKGAPIGFPEEYDLYLMTDPVAPIPGNPHDRSSSHSTSIPCGQWFFFKVSNTKKRWYRFHIHHFTKPNSLYGKGLLPMIISEAGFKEKGIGWQRIGENVEYKPSTRLPLIDFHHGQFKSTLPGKESNNLYTLSFTFKMEFAKDNLYFAYAPPYTYSQLQNMLYVLTKNPSTKSHIQVRPLCRTISGNRVDLVIIAENGSLVKSRDVTGDNEEDDVDRNYHLKDVLPSTNIDPQPILPIDKALPATKPLLKRGGSQSTAQMSNLMNAESSKVVVSSGNDIPDASASVKVPKFLQKLQNQMEVDKEMAKKLRVERSRKPAVFIIARVHPNETNSSWICEGIIKTLLGDNAVAAEMRNFFTFYIIPMLNPDGVVNGFSRNDVSGFDLQDNWLKPDQLLHPAIFYIKELIKNVQASTSIAGFFDLRGHSSKEGMFFHSFLVPPDKKLEIGSETNPAANYQSDPRRFFLAMAKRSKYVNLKYCSLKASKEQLTSAKMYFFKNLKVFLSMTVESSIFSGPKGSLHAYQHIPRNIQSEFHPHLQPIDYGKFGLQFCLALADLYLFPVRPSSANPNANSIAGSRGSSGDNSRRNSSARRGTALGSFSNVVGTPRSAAIPDLSDILENLPILDSDQPFEANLGGSDARVGSRGNPKNSLTSSFIMQQMTMASNALGKTKKLSLKIGSSDHNDQIAQPYLKRGQYNESVVSEKVAQENSNSAGSSEGKKDEESEAEEPQKINKPEEIELDCTEIEHQTDFNESIWEANDKNLSDDAYDHDPQKYFDMHEFIANFDKVDENGEYLLLPDTFSNLRRGNILGLKKYLPENHVINDLQTLHDEVSSKETWKGKSNSNGPNVERNYRSAVATPGFQFIHVIGYTGNNNASTSNAPNSAGSASKVEEKISELERRSAESTKKPSFPTQSIDQSENKDNKGPEKDTTTDSKLVEKSPRITKVGGRKNTIITAAFGTPLKPSSPLNTDNSDGEGGKSRTSTQESGRNVKAMFPDIPPLVLDRLETPPDFISRKADEELDGDMIAPSRDDNENGEEGINPSLAKSSSQRQGLGKKDRSPRRQSLANKHSPRSSIRRSVGASRGSMSSQNGDTSGTDEEKSVSSNASSPRNVSSSKPRSPRRSLVQPAVSKSPSRDEQQSSTDEEGKQPTVSNIPKQSHKIHRPSNARRISKVNPKHVIHAKIDIPSHLTGDNILPGHEEELTENMSSKDDNIHHSLMADESEKMNSPADQTPIELGMVVIPKVTHLEDSVFSSELESIHEERPKTSVSIATESETDLVVNVEVKSSEVGKFNEISEHSDVVNQNRPVEHISMDDSVVGERRGSTVTGETISYPWSQRSQGSSIETVEMSVQTDEQELKSMEEAAKMERLHAILESMFPLRIAQDDKRESIDSNDQEIQDEEKSPSEEIEAIQNSEELQKKIEDEILQSVRKAITHAQHVGNFPFKINVNFTPITSDVAAAEIVPIKSISILSSDLQNVHPLVKAETPASLIETKNKMSNSILATKSSSLNEQSRANSPNAGSLFVNPLLRSSMSMSNSNLKNGESFHGSGRTAALISDSFDFGDEQVARRIQSKDFSQSERESIEIAIAAAKQMLPGEFGGSEEPPMEIDEKGALQQSRSQILMESLQDKSFDEVEAALVAVSTSPKLNTSHRQDPSGKHEVASKIIPNEKNKALPGITIVKSDSQISMDLTELQNAASRTATPREPPQHQLDDESISMMMESTIHDTNQAMTDQEILRQNTINNSQSRNQTPRIMSSGSNNRHIQFSNVNKQHFFTDDDSSIGTATTTDRGLDGFVASTMAVDGSAIVTENTDRIIDRDLSHQPHIANHHGHMIFKKDFDEKQYFSDSVPKSDFEYGNWTHRTANDGAMKQHKFQSKLNEEKSILQTLQEREQQVIEETKKESLEELQAKFLFDMGLDYEHIFGKNGVLTKANWIQRRKSTMKPSMTSTMTAIGPTALWKLIPNPQETLELEQSMTTTQQHHVNLNGTYYNGFPQRQPIYDHLVPVSNQQHIIDSQAKGVGKILHQTTVANSVASTNSSFLASFNVEYLNDYQQQLHSYFQHIVDELKRRDLVNQSGQKSAREEEIEAIAMRVFDMFHNEKSYCFVPRKFVPNSRHSGMVSRSSMMNSPRSEKASTIASSKATTKSYLPQGTLPPGTLPSPVTVPDHMDEREQRNANTNHIAVPNDNKSVQQSRFDQVMQLQKQRRQEEGASKLPNWLPNEIKTLLADPKAFEKQPQIEVQKDVQQLSTRSWIKAGASDAKRNLTNSNSLAMTDEWSGTSQMSGNSQSLNQLDTDFKLEESKSESSYLILLDEGTVGEGDHRISSSKIIEGIPPKQKEVKPFASLPPSLTYKIGFDSLATSSTVMMVGEEGMGGFGSQKSRVPKDILVSGGIKFSDTPPATAPIIGGQPLQEQFQSSLLSKSVDRGISKKTATKVVEIAPTDIVPFSIALPRDDKLKGKNSTTSKQDSIRDKLLEKVKKLQFTQQQSRKEEFVSVMGGGESKIEEKTGGNQKLLYSAGSSLFVLANHFGSKNSGDEENNSKKKSKFVKPNDKLMNKNPRMPIGKSALGNGVTITDTLTNTTEDPAEDGVESRDSVAELNSAGSAEELGGVGDFLGGGSIHSTGSKKLNPQLKRVDSEDSAYVKYGDIYKKKIRDGFDPENKPSLSGAEKVLRFAALPTNESPTSSSGLASPAVGTPSRPNQPKPSHVSNRIR